MTYNVIETLQFNCTTCPSECLLTVEVCLLYTSPSPRD